MPTTTIMQTKAPINVSEISNSLILQEYGLLFRFPSRTENRLSFRIFMFIILCEDKRNVSGYRSQHCLRIVRIRSYWSAFSCFRTEYGEIQSISLYSVQMPENVDQNNSEYGHYSDSITHNPVYTKLIDHKSSTFVNGRGFSALSLYQK